MPGFSQSVPSRSKRRRAQALVEFSIIVPVMLLMVLGLIDLGRAFVFGVAVQEGTRQAARLAGSANVNFTNNALTLKNADVLGRLVAASNPALVGCQALTSPQTCNGGTWALSVSILGPSGAQYARLEDVAANDLAGAKVTVTASGGVALLPGISTGAYGLQLPQIQVQGQSSMVIL